MRILVADDEPGSATALKGLLELMGHEVVGPASDGMEAVGLARKEAPDLAILDIDMPLLSGLDAAGRMAASAPLPVILLTGHSEPEYLERAAGLPVFHYLVKPVRPETLVSAIRLSRARFDEWKSLNGQVSELRERMEERKTIERAKGILMQARGIAEGDAYNLLRTRSQQQGRSMIHICRAVVAAEGVLRRSSSAEAGRAGGA
jgi:response regulator NasT